MDPASVEGAVSVEPAADVTLSWSDDGRRLSVEPVTSWRPATLYTVTVGTGAQDRDGRALGSPLRAGFLTRDLTTARLVVTDKLSSGVALDSAVVISFDRPVPIAGVVRAFRVMPNVPGQLLVATDGPDGSDPTVADNFVWEPSETLAGDTRYTVDLADGVVDEDGSPVAEVERLAFTTTTSPSVVRFRPRAGTEDVGRGVPVSVRFTAADGSRLHRRRVQRGGQRPEGRRLGRLGRGRHRPRVRSEAAVPLRGHRGPAGVDGCARGRRGAPRPRPRGALPRGLEAQADAEARGDVPLRLRGQHAEAAARSRRPRRWPRPPSGSWVAAEKYLLTLLNCTRGGGWVLADGSCSSPGGSGIAPLKYHAGVSNQVARPYAKKLATAGVCSHFYGGTDPGDRLRAAGYTGYQWAENIGCRYFHDPRDAAVSLVRFFQSEKYWSPVGGHYVNMMNRKYTHAGIGLWISGGNLNFVVDFYTP